MNKFLLVTICCCGTAPKSKLPFSLQEKGLRVEVKIKNYDKK